MAFTSSGGTAGREAEVSIRELDVHEIAAAREDDVHHRQLRSAAGRLRRAREAARRPRSRPSGARCSTSSCENADIAAADRVPICQDTGFAVVFVEVGQDVHLVGGRFEDAVDEGVRRGLRATATCASPSPEPAHAAATPRTTRRPSFTPRIVPGDTVALR